jgi:hypothetical protein
VVEDEGGLRTTLALELPKGRREGFETDGIGAWLVMMAPSSSISSWKICRGSLEPAKRVGLAIVARQNTPIIADGRLHLECFD